MSESETVLSELHSTINPEWMHVQLNDYDFYLARPSSLDPHHGSSLPMNQFLRVPVIRVYGFLPTGHQALCHIHGVFPYIFIRYDGQEDDSAATINQRCAQLHNMLEIKSQLSMVKKKNIKQVKQNISDLKYIANVSVVKGIPFYGFHVGYTLFYKISLLDAGFTNKLSDLIRDGKMFGRKTETFESHLPYLLQFSADYNLFGCSWMDFDHCYFRKPVLNTALDLDKILHDEKLENILEQFCDENSNVLPDREFPRIGNGLLEIDILPQFIRNVDEVHFRDLHHDFCEIRGNASSLLNKPYVSSTRKIISDITLQRRLSSLEPYVPVASIQRSAGQEIKWQSSKAFEEDFEKAKARIDSAFADVKLDFDTFVKYSKRSTTTNGIKLVRDSLSELWPICPDISGRAQLRNDLPQVIDTLDGSFNAADVSDEEPDKLPISQDVPPAEHAENPELTINSKGDNCDSSGRPTGLRDVILTQNMAERRVKRKGTSQNFAGSSAVKRLKVKRAGIKYESGSFCYKRCRIEFGTILSDLEMKGFPKIDYADPFFENPLDLRLKPYIYAGKRFEITSPHLSCRLPVPFQEQYMSEDSIRKEKVFSSWKYIKKPPTYSKIAKEAYDSKKKRFRSQLENPTSKADNRFLMNINRGKKAAHSVLHTSLTHFSLEIHVQTEGKNLPDPEKDKVSIIFWCLEKESYPFDLKVSPIGIMVLKDPDVDDHYEKRIQQAAGDIPVAFYEDEFDLLDALIDIVLIIDPDILSGFELHATSWGYIIERCRAAHQFDFADEISRVNTDAKTKVKDRWGYSHASAIVISGRHMINIWRAIKDDLALAKYTIENVSYVVFQERLPHFSSESLSSMWRDNGRISSVKTVLSYWIDRLQLNIRLLQKQEYVPRITELSRLTGIDFYSVYYRGSQYKIESILSRLCKAESFIMVAPSQDRVKQQNALECVPLVMEPESAFYKSPLVVLDFQSLYPSIMMAYNYCYSTILGRVRELDPERNVIGATEISLPKGLLSLLTDHITIAPNGIAYVKSSIRKSTLAKMLEDILDTRFIVKKTMTDIGGSNPMLSRLLNSRQLALKLIANVTYGYTSASFSGRMPCSDLADSIVQTGRETLEKAITLIEDNVDWGAKVVYGDTDSLFVYLPGKSREEAFTIGRAIAEKVTKSNPSPIVLKFEKVYHPSLLLSKKRYVGYMYERNARQSPVFDAKGIETVRRDGHPAQQKIVEKAIRILFDSKDLSKVKQFIQGEFAKIQLGTASVQDFCFSKVVRLGAYKNEQTAPPGAIVATRMMQSDHRARPQYKERVPYVVIKGSAGQLLRDRCVSPEEFVANGSSELDSDYYINKTLVPPLERLFNILGIDVSQWAFELPRQKNVAVSMETKKIDTDLASMHCVNCHKEIGKRDSLLCDACLEHRDETAAQLTLRTESNDARLKAVATVCRTCCFRYNHDASEASDLVAARCDSYDCPVYFERLKATGYVTSRKHNRSLKALKAINHW
ncbi:hypothetical protein HG536_0A07950 [Torulaspora globosa]|uniref:DNA polymerase n=1 Tax=Torulaspora globosa TaxID=48254 RepID=A0A7G3ZBU4_9SACH|nr:uncharacterized protein HG536_0A07950 [Torulaspora globosa]QLL30980.1 hypothetical protein HG536_0A07950 [Torulaspora globosa]